MSWEVRTMQSKTSYFNATLFRKNLTRFWPLWGLASLYRRSVPSGGAAGYGAPGLERPLRTGLHRYVL